MSTVGWTKLKARLELKIQNTKEKNKEYVDYLASLNEGEKNKREKLCEEFLNKDDNFLSIFKELQVNLEWKLKKGPKKESLEENKHCMQRIPVLPLPTFLSNPLG